jgi:rod shape-determining protein MreD
MRNLGFLLAGFFLILVQANLFRLLDDLRVGTVAVAWVFAVAIDIGLTVRDMRALASPGRGAIPVRVHTILPVTVLLAYVIFGAVTHTSLPRPIPSLVLPLILFMGVHEYSLARGAAVAFVLGYATDLLGIAPVGLYTFTYVAIFWLARGAGVRLAAQTFGMQALLVLAFAVLHSVMVIVLLAIFGGDRAAWVSRQLYPLAVPYALATATVAPLVFRLAQRIHFATGAAQRVEAGGGRP